MISYVVSGLKCLICINILIMLYYGRIGGPIEKNRDEETKFLKFNYKGVIMKRKFFPKKSFSIDNVNYDIEVVKEQINEIERLYGCLISTDINNSVALNLTTFATSDYHFDEEKLLIALVNECIDTIGENGLFDLRNKFMSLENLELAGYKFSVKCPC